MQHLGRRECERRKRMFSETISVQSAAAFMIHYSDQLTALVADIVSRVSALSFIDPRDVFVFARFGALETRGVLATCHCVTLPATAPGCYVWRSRETGRVL